MKAKRKLHWRVARKGEGEAFSASTPCVWRAIRKEKDSMRGSPRRRSRNSSVFNRSSKRRSTRSTAAASQLRSGVPATILMIITIHAMKPTTPSNTKNVVASALLLSHPESIATPRSNASEQRMAPSRKVCWRNFSHFQRNSARFSVVSTMVKRKFILVHLYLLDVLLALPPLKASPSY